MKHISKPLIRSFLITVLAQFIPASYSETCDAAYVGVDRYVPGKCVLFQECPPLLKLIRSPTLTASELKLLQNLTCRIDGEIPTICCALKDIKDLVNYNEEARPKPSKGAGIIYPNAAIPAEDNSGSISSEEIDVISGSGALIEDGKQDIKLRNNFNILPKLEECGKSDASDRIIGGEDAPHAGYPWMARIGYLAIKTGEIEFYCGATVISKKYVLTAAHCTEEVDKDYYLPAIVRLGEHDSENDVDCSEVYNGTDCSRAVDLKIEKTIPHPGYDPVNKTDDIELIRVRGTIPFDTPFVKPICLPFAKEYGLEDKIKDNINQFVGKKGVVTGWGRTKWDMDVNDLDKQDGSRVLQNVHLPIVSNTECQKNYSKKIDLWEKQMCAGGQVDKDSCGGDSGGPISIPIAYTKNKRVDVRLFQLGVVSFGATHCGAGGLPGVYTRISAYKEWILENLEN